MTYENILYRAASIAGRLVCALGFVVLIGWLVLVEHLAINASLQLAGTAFALIFSGTALWLQNRGQRPQASRIFAGAAIGVALVNVLQLAAAWRAGDGGMVFGAGPVRMADGFPSRIGAFTSFACLAAAIGLFLEPKAGSRARQSIHIWLAIFVSAVAGGGLVAQGLNRGLPRADLIGPSPWLCAVSTGALLLLALGLVCTRPRDRLPTVLFSHTAAGVLGRRLLIGVLITPVLVTGTLFISRGSLGLSLADGAFLVTLIYTLGGLSVMVFAAQTATGLDELRRTEEQTRDLLTARLQEQAAQLQETVSRRTQELQEANKRLLASNERLELATQAVGVGIWEWEASAQRSRWDQRTMQIYGLTEFDGSLDEWMKLVHPDDRATARAAFQSLLQGANHYTLDCRIVRVDGAVRYIESRGLVQRDAGGRLVRVIGTERDTTAQVEASQRMRLLNERLQLALRSSNYGVFEYDIVSGRLEWDDRMLEIFGLTRSTFTGQLSDWKRRLHPDDVTQAIANFEQGLFSADSRYDSRYRIVLDDGSVRHLESHGYLLRNAEGKPYRIAGLNRDATAEVALQDALHMAEQRWQLAIEGTNEAVWDWDIVGGAVYHDEHWARMLGYALNEIEASIEGWRGLVHPEDLPSCDATTNDHLAGLVPLYQAEYRMRTKSGQWRWILDRGKVVKRSATGQPLRMVGTHSDVTARKDLEQRLRRTDELADQVSRLAHIGGWEIDLQAGRVTWSSEVYRIHEVDESFTPTMEDVRRFFPPGIFEAIETRSSLSPAGTFNYELPLNTAKGRNIWVRVLGRVDLAADQSIRIHGALQDITVQHRTEADRRELETQLFQAQKMETLGTLSGGIAHDFNNLLTGIIGYHELAADSVPEDHPARACLAEARNASLRARELVDQILTFSRQSAETEHGAVDLGLVVEEARRFLRATLPANITIESDLNPSCPAVSADSTQIHQVILNLGSNAAHAMREHGGTLRISLQPREITGDHAARLGGAKPGRYVCLSMSDTGHGMDEATSRRVFEPFFTTKNTREGTGLGLAVVHGIIRAHRGVIDLKSTVGVGTTFNVYLPISADKRTPEAEADTPAPKGAGELVCVVDDEGIVGRFTKATIEKLGYQAVAFSSADECVAAWDASPAPYRVLVTDQTMPGMQGTELAHAMRQKIPNLPVVIMSGYFSKISSQALDELGQVELLAKPFTTEQLAHALHRALR